MTCEKIIIIHQGKIVAQNSIENLAHLEKGHSRVHLKISMKSDLRTHLSQIASVHDVQNLAVDSHEWSVDYTGGDEVLAKISNEISKKDLGLLLLEPQKLDLYVVFLKLTYGNKGEQ
jgi:ABC-2 type transport system ATP-binding protein